MVPLKEDNEKMVQKRIREPLKHKQARAPSPYRINWF